MRIGEKHRRVWNNNRLSSRVFTAIVLFTSAAVSVWAQAVPQAPKLLLNAQRLRRLKRDRERKTPRWVNFENRINRVPDSPERGFELALYYAITGDQAKGRDAIAWGLSHDSQRQKALVADWCAPLLSAGEKAKMNAGAPILAGNDNSQLMRDVWFLQVAFAADASASIPEESRFRRLLASLEKRNPEDLYALCELIYSVRATTRRDLRDVDPHLFAALPEVLLLSARPKELNSPPWLLHAAALALVAIDPNLPSSQFLQSWALEEAQTVREGPGVAYELLWADPYLPGVGYQNMEPWTYDDEHGRLFARASWEPDSCWIKIAKQGVEQENCPPRWQSETVTFGHLTLIPMTARCVEIPHIANRNDSVLVWKFKPGEGVIHGKGKDQHTYAADAAGIWHPGSGIEGKVCIASH